MDTVSYGFTVVMELTESAIRILLTINRYLVSTFYGTLWLVATWLLSVLEGILTLLRIIADIGEHVITGLYWGFEKALVTVSRAVLRLDFISQVVPDTLAALVVSVVDGLSYFFRYCQSLCANIILCLFFPVQLMFSSLEYFGKELRQSAGEAYSGVVSFVWCCKDVPRAVYNWISVENIKSFLLGLPFVWSLDFYLSIVVIALSYFLFRRAVHFMRERHLTCWPILFASQVRRFGLFLRRKVKLRTPEAKGDVACLETDLPVLTLCDSSNTCIICADRTRDTLLLPCRHLCLCSPCWNVIDAESNEQNRICPLCRIRVTAFVSDVFIS